MPIYEYVCESCGRQSSVFQRRINADVAAVCPHCQGSSLRRLVSRFAVLRSVEDSFDDSALAGLDAGMDGGYGGLDDLGDDEFND